MTIYTIGYQCGVRDAQHLQTLAEYLEAVVIDVRYSPGSSNPEWRASWLRNVLGARYIGERGLGNRNYKGGLMILDDPEGAWERLAPILMQQSVILMCACRDPGTCHRAQAAAFLAERSGQPVIHLTPPYPGESA